jgi:DHA2 family methylenomycin A resistance protein-like MFS transporter
LSIPHALAPPIAPAARRRSLTLLATTLGFMVVQLDVTIVNVALQSISSNLGGDVADLQWIVDAYTIIFASTIPAAGALGDRLGAKRLLVAGFAIFTLASLACGLAPSLATLIAARIMQGLGAAILVPCSLALLSHSYDEEKARAKAVAFGRRARASRSPPVRCSAASWS